MVLRAPAQGATEVTAHAHRLDGGHTFERDRRASVCGNAIADIRVNKYLQGTIEGHAHSYRLDTGHAFETGRRTAVCGNTAAMLGEGGASWLAKHFQVTASLPGWEDPEERTCAQPDTLFVLLLPVRPSEVLACRAMRRGRWRSSLRHCRSDVS